MLRQEIQKTMQELMRHANTRLTLGPAPDARMTK
jgi:hypothetical protein